MFAYNQQQYSQGGAAVSTSNGHVWNGSAWVASAVPSAASGYSTYSTGTYGTSNVTAAPGPAPSAQQESPAELVTKYTQYYHQWTARAKEHEQHAQQTEAQWARYYADQASRAAHHFHSNPHVTPSFELPPAPTAAAGQQQQQPSQPQNSYQQQHNVCHQQQQQQFVSPSTNNSTAQATTTVQQNEASGGAPPDSLKRYVHRCLEQCKNAEQRKRVERETEQVIAKALQAGKLHSTNWDKAPLIPVNVGAISSNVHVLNGSLGKREQQYHQPAHTSKKQKLSSNDSYYGPSSSPGQDISAWKPSCQNGHYGPSSVSQPSSYESTNPASSQNYSYYQSPQQQQQQQQSKYSPEVTNQEFIAIPSYGSKKTGKAGKKKNPNNQNDGFQRSSKTLAQRASRFAGPGGMADVHKSSSTTKGIDDRYLGKGVIGGSHKKLDETDYEHMKVKGTCQKLEKQYLRLTAPPKPELVRPLYILQQHLKNLKAEWKLEEGKRRDYLWFCSEMKSMRQDLTVQHISNAFTIDVYETHARMALQEGDLNEFNQAQTQLKLLYHKLDNDSQAVENENEFVAYRMIYFVMMTLNKKYNGGSSDLLNLMLSLTTAQREDPAIQHALQVRSAVADVDYQKFFRLEKSCPNLGGKLLELMVPTVRHWALQRVCRAYRPSVEVNFALGVLGLPAQTEKDLESGMSFLLSCGCILNKNGSDIDTKESVVRESDLQEKRSLI